MFVASSSPLRRYNWQDRTEAQRCLLCKAGRGAVDAVEYLPGTKAVIDVDDAHAACTGVEHAEKRCHAAEARAVAYASGDGDHRDVHKAGDKGRERPLHPCGDCNGMRCVEDGLPPQDAVNTSDADVSHERHGRTHDARRHSGFFCNGQIACACAADDGVARAALEQGSYESTLATAAAQIDSGHDAVFASVDEQELAACQVDSIFKGGAEQLCTRCAGMRSKHVTVLLQEDSRNGDDLLIGLPGGKYDLGKAATCRALKVGRELPRKLTGRFVYVVDGIHIVSFCANAVFCKVRYTVWSIQSSSFRGDVMQAVYAYLGPKGTFCYQAMAEFAARDAAAVDGAAATSVDQEVVAPPKGLEALDAVALECASITEVFEMVDRGRADFGVVPIENALEGGVTATLDAFAFTSDAQILAELVLDIHHSLIAAPGVTAADITEVVSHPQATGQCRRWLAANLPGRPVAATNSTAESVRRAVAAPGVAGIGTSCAAGLYGGEVLEEAIEDNYGNQTRFVKVGRAREPHLRTGHDKTSLALFLKNDRPGALLMILSEFAYGNINLSKIQSRPTKRALGEYMFFIDLEGHVDDIDVKTALDCLRLKLREVKVLGSYPRIDARHG